VPLARPRYCELASCAAWGGGGLRPYIEQRLDSRRVLGGLRPVSYDSLICRATFLTILSSASIGWRCVLSKRRGAEGASRRRAWQNGPSSLSSIVPPKVSTRHSPSRHRAPPGHTFATMSRTSQLTLASTLAGAIGIVVFVHYSQRAEKSVRTLTPIPYA